MNHSIPVPVPVSVPADRFPSPPRLQRSRYTAIPVMAMVASITTGMPPAAETAASPPSSSCVNT